MPPHSLTSAGSKSYLTCAPKTCSGLLNCDHLGSCSFLQNLPLNAYPQHYRFLFPLQSRDMLAQKEFWFCQHQRDYYIPQSWLLRNVWTVLFNYVSSSPARKEREHDWMNKWKRLDMLSCSSLKAAIYERFQWVKFLFLSKANIF